VEAWEQGYGLAQYRGCMLKTDRGIVFICRDDTMSHAYILGKGKKKEQAQQPPSLYGRSNTPTSWKEKKPGSFATFPFEFLASFPKCPLLHAPVTFNAVPLVILGNFPSGL